MLSEEFECTWEELDELHEAQRRDDVEERLKHLEKRVIALENLNKKPDTDYNPSWVDKLKKEKAKL